MNRVLANLKLSQEQIQTLKRQGEDFKTWITSDKGKKENQDHREHEHYFKEQLSCERLKKITESELLEVWKKTWASKVWVDSIYSFR